MFGHAHLVIYISKAITGMLNKASIADKKIHGKLGDCILAEGWVYYH
jgi:hypothetical protein